MDRFQCSCTAQFTGPLCELGACLQAKDAHAVQKFNRRISYSTVLEYRKQTIHA